MEKVVIRKIGGSHYLLIPKSFIDVYKLNEFEYNFFVDDDGKIIIFKRFKKIEEVKGGLK